MAYFRTIAFEEFGLGQLYEVLRLRSQVFVVEQDCVYQDMDDKDALALHVLGYENGILAAYARIFKPGDYHKEAAIGRVVVHPEFRKEGLGILLMTAAIDSVKSNWGCTKIHISAQSHLRHFYEGVGFVWTGEAYLEDGIPHIAMIRG